MQAVLTRGAFALVSVFVLLLMYDHKPPEGEILAMKRKQIRSIDGILVHTQFISRRGMQVVISIYRGAG